MLENCYSILLILDVPCVLGFVVIDGFPLMFLWASSATPWSCCRSVLTARWLFWSRFNSDYVTFCWFIPMHLFCFLCNIFIFLVLIFFFNSIEWMIVVYYNLKLYMDSSSIYSHWSRFFLSASAHQSRVLFWTLLIERNHCSFIYYIYFYECTAYLLIACIRTKK